MPAVLSFLKRRSPVSLPGKVAVVTGASGALGADVATALAVRGVKVGLLARNEEKLNSLAAKLGGPQFAFAAPATVRDLSSVEAAVAKVVDHFGGIDIVVAAAGMATAKRVEEYSEESFLDDIDTNLAGVWRTFRATLPHVKKSRGHMCAIASMAAFVHMPALSSYSASKSGVMALCDSLRLELEGTGVSVGTVNPTFFDSALGNALESDPALIEASGDFSGPFTPLKSRSSVVDAVMENVENRSRITVLPRLFAPASLASGATQMVLDQVVRFNLSRGTHR